MKLKDKLESIEDCMARVKATGSHYFDKDTIRYFRARFHASASLSDGSVLIVESTKRVGFGPIDGNREYRVMRVNLEGEIFHYDDKRIFPTKAKALKDMYRLADTYETTGKIEGEES